MRTDPLNTPSAASQPARYSRRRFVGAAAKSAAAVAVGIGACPGLAQIAGDRPKREPTAAVLNPRDRMPVSLIIDDSTCLVNLNRFAMPQFDEAHEGKNAVYLRDWQSWPAEIPDDFVREFGEWCGAQGVKGKYSIVPYPACVGRLDRFLPGWSRKALDQSIGLVRSLMTPNWDIHPEMVTHTRVIDLRTGQPFPEASLKFMENWEWTTGKSVDELASYMAYALRILENVGLHCDGITTPGGFGNQVLPELAQATLQSVRDVFGTPTPHYFRHLYDEGPRSVAPRVEYASGLDGDDPRCVVSIIGCTGDWTGGWDCTPPEGADRFITPDLQKGRMVDVITRGEPAVMVCHWTGIYWNGQKLGFKIFQEVVKRLHSRFDDLIWMKLGELASYWAARHLTTITRKDDAITFFAPFPCADFTVQCGGVVGPPLLWIGLSSVALKEVSSRRFLREGTWCKDVNGAVACFRLPAGASSLQFGP